MTDAAMTPMRAWSCRAGSLIAMSTMKSEMVKPIPDSAAPPATRRSRSPGRQLAEARAAHQPRRTGDADELAEHQAGDDAPRQRRARRGRQAGRVQPDPGVDQCEQRQHQERHVRPDIGLQSFVDRNRLAQTAGGGAGVLRVRRLPECPDHLDRIFDLLTLGREHRDQQCQRRRRRASDGCPP